MRRRHLMPFGAALDAASGAGVFSLWAPAAGKVSLELTHDGHRRSHPMRTDGQGWFGITVPRTAAGARYTFRIDGRLSVPDPASRSNPDDVHGASALTDPLAFQWSDTEWLGRPWEEAVVYELHTGTFTPEGTFNAAIERLDYLVQLGVTAVELMPVADFPGRRGWGYDGVLPFAPDASYGTPEDLKSLVEAAHARGLMIVLDVVYNHFGPDGNYLGEYAPQFFDPNLHTPWGAAINFGGEGSRPVRDFFIHNALYWLEEFHFDGLRLDAVHAIIDRSEPDFITELAAAVRDGPGRNRHVHLILENDKNQAHYLSQGEPLRPAGADAQWNDDFHHAAHVLVTGERDGYYEDYADAPMERLGRCLAEGFAYQGEPSRHRGGTPRGEPSRDLSPCAFVDFLQDHDQVGNRALGERIHALAPPHALRLAVMCFLLAPQVPMLFMGEEFAASSPFLYFCDFEPPLSNAVTEGRRREFASFARFRDERARAAIPDPNAESTFTASKLRWDEVAAPGHRDWHTLYSDLLELRRTHILPHLRGSRHAGRFAVRGTGLAVDWTLPDGAKLALRANFSATAWAAPRAAGKVLYPRGGAADEVKPWTALWMLEAGD